MSIKNLLHYNNDGTMSEPNKKKSVCFVAGKSGGHIIPCLTQAEQLVTRYPEYHVLFFSTSTALDQKLIAQNHYVSHHVALPLSDVPYKKLIQYPRFFLQFCKAFFVSLYHLFKQKPKRVITTGGYCAIPVCLAARVLKIPVELQLLDVVPGRAIRFLSRFAQVIGICFEQSKHYLPQHKCMLMNYPVRFKKQDAALTGTQARTMLKLAHDRFTIFVLGGSQGSIYLNSVIKEWLLSNPHLHGSLQVIHQTGSNDVTDWESFYKQNNICAFVFSYYQQLNYCYRAADVVICRAGAGVLFELAYFNARCIMIPLKSDTTTHQYDNALAFSQKYPQRCTLVLQESVAITKHKLHAHLNALLTGTKTEKNPAQMQS